ncbi:ABC transporter permease [Dyella humicola]|uniref:ABC transporter permease n=1 Tax=Dyella humicola TaxID=2992126 RepID=UPI00225AED43|nr:ABC transporter permease [Dyella humicola]
MSLEFPSNIAASRSDTGPFSAIGRHWSLTKELAKRDVLGRYKGASFGLLWSLISPFLMLLVYSFAFGFVMKARWPQAENGQTHYSIILFVGLIVHGFFAECLSRSPHLVTGNVNFVKRVIFPLEILPWPMVMSALFHAVMNFLVFLVLHLALDHTLAWTTLLLPLVMLPLVIFALGMSWFLAALGVYLRDIGQITGVIATAMLFTSTAMFPIEALPPAYRWPLRLNPLTFIIDQARDVTLWGRLPDWLGLGVYTLCALVVLYGGYGVFRLTRRGFADVI